MRPLSFRKFGFFPSCVVCSLFAHVLAAYAVNLFGTCHFGAAVNAPPAVMVSLAEPGEGAAAPRKEGRHEEGATVDPPAPRAASSVDASVATPPQSLPQAPPEETAGEDAVPAAEAPPEKAEPEPPAIAPAAIAQQVAAAPAQAAPPTAARPPVPHPDSAPAPEGGSAAPSAKYEKLTYQVSMHGVPIGNAELEARNEDRVTSITLKVKSNAVTSGIYPVDDMVETQRIDRKYLMTKIRQLEGNFRSDETFTINLEKKRVSWSDNLNYRNLKTTVPADDVLDTLSGIYSLRTRDLRVGKTETLHIFDSESYAEVPVEIVRREEMRLPNLTKVNTLVVRPLQKSAGIFRRTGDILIWMTDDADKVPVKIVTSIPLGRVTAELVSAESKPF